MKITTAGNLFTARARGQGVFFLARRTHSRASHSFSRAVKLSKKKEEKKSKQRNNQQQKQRKRKTAVDSLHEWQF